MDTVELPHIDTQKTPSVFTLVGPYKGTIVILMLLGLVMNAFTLYLPTLIAKIINTFTAGNADIQGLIVEFGIISIGILLFAMVQAVFQTLASEKVARDIRSSLVKKISQQNYRFIDEKNPAKLLTNITSDIDSIKQFVAQAITSLISSTVIIIGVASILLYTDWKLGLAVLTIIPVIGLTFFFILRKVRELFHQSREVIDSLNKTINESIVGAALIRVLNAQAAEHSKFSITNSKARSVGIGILQLFSILVPTITFISSIGTLIVVSVGGYFVTSGSMSLGSFVAFNSYIAILIFPILILGFISNIVSQASVAYARIYQVLTAPDISNTGTITDHLDGAITVTDVNVVYGEKYALKDISFVIKPKTKTAIIGPTGGGKTQLLNVMAGLTIPNSGDILFDGKPRDAYESISFYRQIGLVFQDSILFNTTLRENIAFSTEVTNTALQKAIDTAELSDFITTLPEGLDTVVSERGNSLSGGQKQRVMLARALALDPTILFLDDFTARVDNATEQRILANIEKNYPQLTLISITQKITPIEEYDQIILLMEGELLAIGTHQTLLNSSTEYQQIYNSQRSTHTYELRS